MFAGLRKGAKGPRSRRYPPPSTLTPAAGGAHRRSPAQVPQPPTPRSEQPGAALPNYSAITIVTITTRATAAISPYPIPSYPVPSCRAPTAPPRRRSGSGEGTAALWAPGRAQPGCRSPRPGGMRGCEAARIREWIRDSTMRASADTAVTARMRGSTMRGWQRGCRAGQIRDPSTEGLSPAHVPSGAGPGGAGAANAAESRAGRGQRGGRGGERRPSPAATPGREAPLAAAPRGSAPARAAPRWEAALSPSSPYLPGPRHTPLRDPRGACGG